MPTSGHCHFHSAPGTWAPRARLPPDSCLARGMSPPASRVASSSPSKCVNTKTIRVKPDRGELGPAGSPSVRETGVRTCPPRAERLRASSPRSLGAASDSWPAPSRPAVLTRDARPGSPRRGRGQCGDAGLLGLRAPRRSRRCRAARPTAAALLGPAALRPARRLPMGAVRAPLPAASGAEPREPVGNRAPIGSPDNRSASRRPIRGGGYRSGAFRVGQESDNRSTLGTRAASRPVAPGWKDAGAARPGAATPQGAGGEAWGKQWKAAEARRAGERRGSPNKAASGGPSGLRLLRL